MHIYDNEFIRGKVPMTKQEIRAITIGKLQLNKDSVLIDVGAGTGSISIEASRYLENGTVFAIEKNSEGCELIRENCRRFSVTNLELIEGLAPEDIPDVQYDRMFIGGSNGRLEEILKHFLENSAKDSKLVMNIVALESLNRCLTLLKKFEFEDVEICHVNISRGEKQRRYTIMRGENPIYIVTAKKGEIWVNL